MVDILEPKELDRRLKAGESLVLLDVREAHELAVCQIEGARHMPMGEVPARHDELDPEAPLVVICHHGLRSAQVAAWLESQADFEAVHNLAGGVDRWALEVDASMARY